MEKKEYIVKEFEKINISLDEKQAGQFLDYYNLLEDWNRKFNLTAITGFEDVALKHFIDSAYGVEYLKGRSSLCDIGAGAGFPSLPLKILYPQIKLAMMDSVNKKIVFLQEAVKLLKLENCECIHIRAEDASRGKYREAFDAVTARAVAQINTLCEYALPLVKTGGVFIAYKGDAEEEIINAQNAIKILGGKLKEIKKFNLSGTDMKRSLVIIEKVIKTDKKYPRGKGKEKNNPL